MRAISRQASKKLSRARGQLLVEAMVAISVTIVGLLGIFSLLSRTLGLYKTVSDQYVAANLAAEGIEVTKNILDSNFISGGPWNKGFADQPKASFEVQYNSRNLNPVLNKPLNFDPATGIYSYDLNGSTTNFRRKIIIENKIGENEIQVNSVVTWKTHGGLNDSEINLEDHFFNWR